LGTTWCHGTGDRPVTSKFANFAGGMLIIVFKPFKVGHTIEAQGVLLQLVKFKFCNQLITPNNQTVFIPNGIFSNGNITIILWKIEELI
jgi:small-conductance mechanosensitive channel